MSILIIDNYDSFTYNLVQYLGELGQDILVKRNDEISCSEITNLNPSHILISPGPGSPNDAGISKEVIKTFAGKMPILGVCLGHQCIGEVFGATITNAPSLMHGKTSNIFHKNKSIFFGIDSPFIATRYHSLIIEKESVNNTELEIIATTEDNLIMAVQHSSHKNLIGVQFHPESILTTCGKTLLSNFLKVT